MTIFCEVWSLGFFDRKERRNLPVYLSATHLYLLEMHKSILQLWRPIVWLLMELDTPLWAFFVDPLKGGFPIFCLLPCLYLYPAALLLYLQSRLIRVNPLRGEGQSYHKQFLNIDFMFSLNPTQSSPFSSWTNYILEQFQRYKGSCFSAFVINYLSLLFAYLIYFQAQKNCQWPWSERNSIVL